MEKKNIWLKPLLSGEQMKMADSLTLKQQSVTGWHLMERAAKELTKLILELYSHPDQEFLLMCGKGNNGGDGLAIARMLKNAFRNVQVVLLHEKGNSEEYAVNLQSVHKQFQNSVFLWGDKNIISENKVIIDCILGFMCTREPVNPEAEAIDWINNTGSPVIAVDIPSGMPVDQIPSWQVVKATHTLNIGPSKLTALLPETGPFFGKIHQVDIGHAEIPDFVNKNMITHGYIKSILKKRPDFGHKGTFGHAGLITGSYTMMGAAVLSCKACLRSGVGLVTSFVPDGGSLVLQLSAPEAISMTLDMTTGSMDFEKFSAIGLGCGMGTDIKASKWLKEFLEKVSIPKVIDADALNIIALDKLTIPNGTIITPHPKEFERLFGATDNSLKRLELQKKMAVELCIIIVLKGHHTTIALPDGTIFFNTTGNSGMAKGGSGDVLTGLMTGMLAQGYDSKDAACLAVYIHGLAGDQSALTKGMISMTASDLIDHLPVAFKIFDS